MADHEKRIEELEVKVAFQEHLINQLDDVIRMLRDHVEDLQRDVRAITEAISKEEHGDLPDEKPPHY